MTYQKQKRSITQFFADKQKFQDCGCLPGIIDIINKFDSNEITLSFANREIDSYINRAYDFTQIKFLEEVKQMLNNIYKTKEKNNA